MRIPGCLLILLALFSCDNSTSDDVDQGIIQTVNGSVPSDETGKTLIHEHMLVDFIGADSTGYHRWNRDSAFSVILPYLQEIKKLGIQTIVDCTPAYLGRDPVLLKKLSDASAIAILTTTGFYGARDNKYLPAFVVDQTASELAQLWIDEFEDGIEGSGIRPGLIKIGVSPDSLSSIHTKLVEAAALTHKATGLTIASHTGPAIPAMQQIKILSENQVDPENFIWVHAHTEKDLETHIRAARLGAWISLDGVNEESASEILEMILNLRSHGLLNRVLISHDAGWYSPGEHNGGSFRDFTYISRKFLPALEAAGLGPEEIEMLLITNPAKALQLK